ncbi:hypothetical protein [Pseudomonas caricapapayae]|uniref:hypothetical protein n=1 Tax=Pseudomonas caricapapayae TaxID=46678 RepID=UPI000A9ADB65|nr:hypothetical protein [Pseudomonas caricapapayae]
MAVLLFSVITGSGLPSNDSDNGFPFDLLAMSHVSGRRVTPVRKWFGNTSAPAGRFF